MRYDTVLCDKVNKHTVDSIRQELTKELMNKTECKDHLLRAKTQGEGLSTRLDKLDTIIGNLRCNMAEYVDGYVSSSLNDRMKMYESITVQFSKFFNEDDLASRLDEKLDHKTFYKISTLKASRDELNQAMGIIETLFDRVRHIALMQVEITRALVP